MVINWIKTFDPNRNVNGLCGKVHNITLFWIWEERSFTNPWTVDERGLGVNVIKCVGREKEVKDSCEELLKELHYMLSSDYAEWNEGEL